VGIQQIERVVAAQLLHELEYGQKVEQPVKNHSHPGGDKIPRMVDLHAIDPLPRFDQGKLLPSMGETNPGKIWHRRHNAQIVELCQVSHSFFDKYAENWVNVIGK
jgi:hypothetical protein